MEYITVKEAAEKWNTSVQVVRRFCRQERIAGVVQQEGAWLIPKYAKKPGRAEGGERGGGGSGADASQLPTHLCFPNADAWC